MLLLIRRKLTSRTMKHNMKFGTEFFRKYIIATVTLVEAAISCITIPKRPEYVTKIIFLLTYSQWLTSLLMVALFCGFLSLYTILIAVACAQCQKLKAAILDIRQQYITSHHLQEDEKFHATANCDLQAKLNTCIRHHQEIME